MSIGMQIFFEGAKLKESELSEFLIRTEKGSFFMAYPQQKSPPKTSILGGRFLLPLSFQI